MGLQYRPGHCPSFAVLSSASVKPMPVRRCFSSPLQSGFHLPDRLPYLLFSSQIPPCYLCIFKQPLVFYLPYHVQNCPIPALHNSYHPLPKFQRFRLSDDRISDIAKLLNRLQGKSCFPEGPKQILSQRIDRYAIIGNKHIHALPGVVTVTTLSQTVGIRLRKQRRYDNGTIGACRGIRMAAGSPRTTPSEPVTTLTLKSKSISSAPRTT